MGVFIKSKIKKWINANKKSRLFYNAEQGYIHNGFMLLKADTTVKEVLREELIREESFSFVEGKFREIIDCNQLINEKDLIELEDTKIFIKTNKCDLARVFNTPGGESIIVQNVFFESIADCINPTFKGTNGVSPVYMYVNDAFYGLFLPIRSNKNYKIIEANKDEMLQI